MFTQTFYRLLFVIANIFVVHGFYESTPTQSGEFPSLVSIHSPFVAHSHCNGVILNANHVLTSCRCVFDTNKRLISPFWLRIIAGDLNIMIPSYRRFTTDVTHIFPHPHYNSETHENDVAILRVRTMFPMPHNTIDVAIRNGRVLPNGLNCKIAGWAIVLSQTGGINAPGITATQQSLVGTIIDRNRCNAANVYEGKIQENMLCVGGSAKFCEGTVGSGLFCDGELTGILSFGDNTNCATAQTHPGGFTQIRFFDDWINQQFVRNESIPPGSTIGSFE